jgi:hypothetical protein
MENNNNFKTFFNRIPLNKIIDNYDKNKFLNINKIKIIETEINKVKKLPKNMSNRNKIKTLKKRKLSLQPKHLREKKISNIIGVDEGLISLPKVLSTKIWKKNNENEMEKKNTEKILKNNFGSITNYLSEDDKDNKELFKEKKIEENEIKKLNNWDLLHIKDMKNVKHSQSFKFIAKNLEMPEIKWMLDIKNDPKSINILSRNKKLKEFFKGLEEEQNAIFNMNMNINKKNYLLDVYNDDNNEEDVEINREDKKSSVDYYKDVMRDKIKVEEFLRNDLADLSQQIYDKKNMKKKLAININKIINKINNIEFEKKNYYENQNEKIKFFEENHNFYFDINNNNNKRKKNKNNSSKNLINEYKNNFNEKISNKEKKIYNKREIQKLKTNLNNFLTSLNTKKIELNKELKTLQNNVKIIEEEIKKIKVRISSRIIEQRKYFFDILKKGIDVRKEGLSWVIIKLIELNGFFEESKFPKFLNNSQIDYLLKISYKQYELNELLKLFYVLKDKQNCLKNEYEKHHKKEVNSNDLNENKKDNFNEENNENYSIPIKYYKKFENIAQKYEKVTNIRINEQKEEKYLKKIVCDLQEKIKKKYYYSKEKINFDNENNENDDENDENDKLLFLPGSLAEFFSKNKKFRDYFDDIFYLNSEIRKRQKEIKNLRKEEIEKFKKNNKGKISNLNMIFLALFGNGINI